MYRSTLGLRGIKKKKRSAVLDVLPEDAPVSGLGFEVQGSGFRVQGLGFRVWSLGFRVQGLGFRFQGSGFRV